MPIWMRKFTYNQIREFYEKQREEEEKAMNKAKGYQDATKIAKPPVVNPTYTTKAPTKK